MDTRFSLSAAARNEFAATAGQRTVVRVDIARVLSKYAGEVERHLYDLFAKAEMQGWILVFDEADALFGRRTDVRDAHDRYSSRDIAWLLQRIERHPGKIIVPHTKADAALLASLPRVVRFPP